MGNEFEQTDLAASEKVKKNPETCERARTNLEVLEGTGRIRVRNDQGEIRQLNEEDREAEIAKAIDASGK